MLHDGNLVGLDEPRRLQESLAARVVALQVDRPRRAVAYLAEVPQVESAATFGEAVRLVLRKDADWAGVRADLERSGFTVRNADIARPTLEDVFVELVERKRRHDV
jgi:ABC-type uncharacterized transport system ATPase subunit